MREGTGRSRTGMRGDIEGGRVAAIREVVCVGGSAKHRVKVGVVNTDQHRLYISCVKHH